MVLIKSILESIKEAFNEDYFKSVSSITYEDFSKENSTHSVLFNEKLDLKNDLFEDLRISVLIGEYISCRNYLDTLKETETFLSSMRKSLVFSNFEESNPAHLQYDKLLQEEFVKPLISTIRISIFYLNTILNNIDGNNHNIVYNDLDSFETPFNNIESYNESIRDQIDLVSYAWHVAFFDHFLSFSQQYISKLLKIRFSIKKIKSLTTYQSFNIILEKANFLILKVNRQDIRHNNKSADKLRHISIEFQEKEFNEQDFNCSTYYNDLLIITKSIHDDDRFIIDEAKKILLTNNDNFQSCNFQDFFILTKYFKDVKKDLSQLEVVLAAFEKKRKLCTKTPFDNHAFDVSINYIHNNIFSFKIQNEPFDTNKFDKYFENVKTTQSIYKCKNYFPYYKYLHVIKSNIEKSTNNDLAVLKNLALKQKELLKDHSEYLKLSKKIDFLIYQLPHYECRRGQIKHRNFDYELFVSSTFILPNVYETEIEEISNIRDSIYENYLDQIVKYSGHNEDLLKKALKKVDDFNAEKTRSIELISIFTAVIALVIAGLSSTRIENKFDALLTFIIFFSAIVFFIALIITITQTAIKTYFHKSLLFIIIVFTFLTLGGSSLFLYNSTINIKKTAEPIDSLKKEIIFLNKKDSILSSEFKELNKIRTDTISNPQTLKSSAN